ncbi:MAG: ComF family protein [Duncaniella sp.]|nr:ComF family protein [Duncaniella sp.]
MNRLRLKQLIRCVADVVTDVVDVVMPRLCTVCATPLLKGEDVMCVGCMMDFPSTNLHLTQPNIIHDRLVTLMAPVERCASMFYYSKESRYSRLIVDAKYQGRPSIGRKLAGRFASELQPAGFFDGIDLILPIPIHFLRRMQRGYNQTEAIAEGLSMATGIPVGSNLWARKWHSTQTRKNAEARRRNSASTLAVRNPQELLGKHVLVVDDVITTGSTMVAALETLKQSQPTVRLSVLSLALTQN